MDNRVTVSMVPILWPAGPKNLKVELHQGKYSSLFSLWEPWRGDSYNLANLIETILDYWYGANPDKKIVSHQFVYGDDNLIFGLSIVFEPKEE